MSTFVPGGGSSDIANSDESGVVRSVVVIDDHLLLAEALVDVLEGYGVDARAAEALTIDGILNDLTTSPPDAVILDHHLGGEIGTSTALIPKINQLGIAVLVVTGDMGRMTVAECLEAGAAGVLNKGVPAGAVLEGLTKAVSGRQIVTDAERQELITALREERSRRSRRLSRFDQLTPREAEVLRMICDGLSAAEIADESYVSLATVRSQIRSILMKLGVRSQLAAAAEARQSGWLDAAGTDIELPHAGLG